MLNFTIIKCFDISNNMFLETSENKDNEKILDKQDVELENITINSVAHLYHKFIS